MWEDAIVKETRDLREEYSSEFDHNLDAIFADIRLRQKKSCRTKVSFPGRKVNAGRQMMQASEESTGYSA
jgi:hypothetical protein